MPPPSPILRRATIAEILDLRHAVLRQGLPRQMAHFPGDDAPLTTHFGAFDDGRCVACLTMLLNSWDGREAWQLRGMAVADGHRGRGLGRQLLEYAVADALAQRRTGVLWCNARTTAAGFYRRMGWESIGENFHIEHAGPHVRMLRKV